MEHGCPRCSSTAYDCHAAGVMSHRFKRTISSLIAGQEVEAIFRYDSDPETNEDFRHPWGRGRLSCFCRICTFEWDWETADWWTW